MSAFEWSFLAGLAVVCVFAWDQFNQKSWQAQRKYALMLSVLNPADLRGGRPLRRAFVIYLLILALFYAAAVFMVSVGVIAFDAETGAVTPDSQGGGVSPGGAVPDAAAPTADAAGSATAERQPVDEGGGDSQPRPEPWVPLAISLAMVGLAPRVALLSEFELRLRLLTHKLMGIPSALHTGSESIATAPLTLEQIGPELVSEDNLAQIRTYLRAAERVLGPGAWIDRLERSLMKILAFRVWVVDQEIFPGDAIRARYALIEDDVRAAIEALSDDLDDLSGRNADALSGPVSTPQPRPALVKRWENRIRAAADLSEDACALMFVYYEKSEAPQGRGARSDAVVEYLGAVLDRDRSTVVQLNMLLTSIFAAVAIAALWGYLQARYQIWVGGSSIYDPPRTSLLFALTALMTYGPATLVAVWWREQQAGALGRARRSQEARVFPMTRLLGLFLISASVALVSLMLLNIGSAISAVGVGMVADNLAGVLWGAFTGELPRCVLGGLQGVFIALMFDQSSEDLARGRAYRVVALHGLALLAWAGFSVELTAGTFSFENLMLGAPVAGLIGWVSSYVLLRALRSTTDAADPPAMAPPAPPATAERPRLAAIRSS